MYEDYSKSVYLSIDIETYDPDLMKMGTGVYRSTPLDFMNEKGYILGVSLADENGVADYYNLGHYDCTKDLRNNNIEYLRETLGQDHIIVGTHFVYDLDWLENWLKIKVNGDIIDIQIAEGLLDEYQKHYNLDFMGKKYFGESSGKETTEMDKFCANNDFKGDIRKYLWKAPYYVVRDYAMQDATLPLEIWKIQSKMIEEQGLTEVFKMECDLLRPIVEMKRVGVRIDTQLRDKSIKELKARLKENEENLYKDNGKFNYNSTQQLAKIMDKYKITYPLTDKGNPSVTKDFLDSVSKKMVDGVSDEAAKVAELIIDTRKADKILGSFLSGSLVKFITNGNLIHCDFNSMKTDQYGTKSGRFSSSNPNLQQMPSPSRNKYYGGITRRPFVPFDNSFWVKLDYSQIEYRFIAHYARGEGAEEIRANYTNNPDTDYHKYIQDLTGLPRSEAKTVNFGISYGMGAEKMARENQWEMDYCYNVLNTYHKKAPFVKVTIRAVENIARKRGFIHTIMGRRARLIDPNKAYVMYNRLMQGSAADMMKKAIVDIYKAGLFERLKFHLTVHDELDISVPKTQAGVDDVFEVKRIMESCIKLKVPVIADMEVGKNWADLKEVSSKKEVLSMIKNNEL